MTAISYVECKKHTQPGEPLQGYIDAVGDWRILDPNEPTYSRTAALKWRPSINFCQIRCLHDPMAWGVADRVRDNHKLHMNADETAYAAWVISDGGSDFTPWSPFKNGTYLPYVSPIFDYQLVTGHPEAHRWDMYDVPPAQEKK